MKCFAEKKYINMGYKRCLPEIELHSWYNSPPNKQLLQFYKPTSFLFHVTKTQIIS